MNFSKKSFAVLFLFGIIGQIAWTVENMYFNLFVFDEISPDLGIITLMVQASGIAATLVTLVAGALSDKIGNRRSFISIGYMIWGVTVALFGFISPELMESLFGLDYDSAVKAALITVVIGDCVMTLFGSTANDAAFSAWVTDNTTESNRGRIESILAIFPLASMLIVAGGFGIIKEAIGYKLMFLLLGIVISAAGVFGIFMIKDSDKLERGGTLLDMLNGFKPRTVMENKPFYLALAITCVYGIACQIFMPFLIIFMTQYLGFGTLEYSAVFAIAIIFGAVINIFLGKLSDKINKAYAMYFATGIFAVGLFLMYLTSSLSKNLALIFFGIAGFVMITGYIYISALSGAIVRDYTPKEDTGKLQGVRMIFFVLIPMLLGPAIGNAINAHQGIKLPDSSSADMMTTHYIPAPEIFLFGAMISLLIFTLIPILIKITKKDVMESASITDQNDNV